MNKLSQPVVSVIIPVYNGMKFLPECLPSVLALDYPNREIIVIDDHSADGTFEYLKKHYPDLTVIRHEKNLGLVRGFNEGFRMAGGKYVFYVNQDTVFSPDYLKICVRKMEEDSGVAAIAGKILKYDFDAHRRTGIIDSTGLQMLKNRRVLDHGQGEEDRGQHQKAGRVFGITGCCPLYRRSALAEIAIPLPGRPHPELFDEDFYMYKEEVDLAWRLRLFGWQAWYEPAAVAWHGRATAAVKRPGYLGILRNRGRLSAFQKYYSIKNRYLMQLKNELPALYFRHFPRIFWNDLLYFMYNLFFNIKNIKAYFAALAQFPQMLVKRRWIMKHRRACSSEMQQWFKTK